MLKRLYFEERGEDLAEYALLLAFIAVVVIVSGILPLVGEAVNNIFTEIEEALSGAL